MKRERRNTKTRDDGGTRVDGLLQNRQNDLFRMRTAVEIGHTSERLSSGRSSGRGVGEGCRETATPPPKFDAKVSGHAAKSGHGGEEATAARRRVKSSLVGRHADAAEDMLETERRTMRRQRRVNEGGSVAERIGEGCIGITEDEAGVRNVREGMAEDRVEINTSDAANTEAIATLEIGKSKNRRCSRNRVKTSNSRRNEGSPGVGRVTGGRRGRRRKIKRRMERRDGWWSDGNGREDSGAARWCIVNGTSSRRRGMQKHGVFRS